tara:strand:+ start:206 stop:682 length:477 start_codon:yes stop_codon:yes gene_type:complete
MEIFKDVPGYEKIYQVSNFGRVKSLIGLTDRILKANVVGSGYNAISLSKEGKVVTKRIHQLVAMSFLGHEPNGHALVVNHIDFDKTNNHVSNLEIVTNRENTNHKHLKSTSKYIGVSFQTSRNKWKSNIYIDGVQKYLGLFNCETSAHLAYQLELAKL